jgi:hypothetical protein
MAKSRGKRYPAAVVAVSSRRLADDLARHGVVARKTCRTAFPHHLPLALQRHWVRGLWDGDGTTAYRTRGVARRHVGICGSRSLVAEVREVLIARCALALRPAISRNGRSHVCWRTQWRGRHDVGRLADYLFAEGGPALPRKRDVLLEALAHARPKHVGEGPAVDSESAVSRRPGRDARPRPRPPPGSRTATAGRVPVLGAAARTLCRSKPGLGAPTSAEPVGAT